MIITYQVHAVNREAHKAYRTTPNYDPSSSLLSLHGHLISTMANGTQTGAFRSMSETMPANVSKLASPTRSAFSAIFPKRPGFLNHTIFLNRAIHLTQHHQLKKHGLSA